MKKIPREHGDRVRAYYVGGAITGEISFINHATGSVTITPGVTGPDSCLEVHWKATRKLKEHRRLFAHKKDMAAQDVCPIPLYKKCPKFFESEYVELVVKKLTKN